MPDESFEEKSEKASPRKRRDARKKGQVAKSRELPSVAVLMTALVSLAVFGGAMYGQFSALVDRTWALADEGPFDAPSFIEFADDAVIGFLLTILPILAAVVLAALLSNILQVGFLLSAEPIRPKLSKLDPIKGFGRLLSKNALVELVKTILKLAIVSAVAYASIKTEMAELALLGTLEPISIAGYTLSKTFVIFIKCTFAMIVIVALDFAFQKWDHEKKLRMTKKEVKDEHKKTEGDPLVKSRIRTIQMQMARRRMMQDVPKADVVITNPTRLAVALVYDRTAMGAPKVAAKGAGAIAGRIRETARQHHIPIIEDKPLAQNLYKWVPVGQEIPGDYYQAVAEILAYIYKMKGKIRQSSAG